MKLLGLLLLIAASGQVKTISVDPILGVTSWNFSCTRNDRNSWNICCSFSTLRIQWVTTLTTILLKPEANSAFCWLDSTKMELMKYRTVRRPLVFPKKRENNFLTSIRSPSGNNHSRPHRRSLRDSQNSWKRAMYRWRHYAMANHSRRSRSSHLELLELVHWRNLRINGRTSLLHSGKQLQGLWRPEHGLESLHRGKLGASAFFKYFIN